jgi:hypothetical protein
LRHVFRHDDGSRLIDHVAGVVHCFGDDGVARVANAQEATMTGTVTDSTGGVLPGVTVTATHEDSGNTFLAITDGAGTFRIPLRIGRYSLTAELAGFTTVTRTGMQAQVGQQLAVNLQMAPSTVQETVTVTGEAPLIDVVSSTVSGNIDQRQVQDLPLNGRNWLDLKLLAPGSRSNACGESPIPRAQVAFQINMDGQQVSNSVTSTTQPRYSRDSIAEFEFVSNRFDATQGRSMGVVVNAISKSGTNRPAGTFSGYFRDAKLNAKDYVLNRPPYSISSSPGHTAGRSEDRIHIFANYEYEREPQTYVYASPAFPKFDMDLEGTRTQYTGGVKADFQFTNRTRMSTRFTDYHQYIPGSGGGATTHVSGATEADRRTRQLWNQFTQVLGSNTVNEIKGGYFDYNWGFTSLTQIQGGAFPSCAAETRGCSLRIDAVSRCVAIPSAPPRTSRNASARTACKCAMTSRSRNAAGRHDVRMGGEFPAPRLRFPVVQLLQRESRCHTGSRPVGRRLVRDVPGVERRRDLESAAAQRELDSLSPVSGRFPLAEHTERVCLVVAG